MRHTDKREHYSELRKKEVFHLAVESSLRYSVNRKNRRGRIAFPCSTFCLTKGQSQNFTFVCLVLLEVTLEGIRDGEKSLPIRNEQRTQKQSGNKSTIFQCELVLIPEPCRYTIYLK